MLKENVEEYESTDCFKTSDILMTVSCLKRRREILLKNINARKRIIKVAKMEFNSSEKDIQNINDEIQSLKKN